MPTSYAEAIGTTTCPWTLSISGEAMQRGAFAVTNMDELVGVVFRHADVTVPDEPYVLARAPIEAAFDASLPMVFSGAVTRTGTAVARADQFAELETTRQWFIDNIARPPATTEGTRAAQLVAVNGVTFDFDIHVLRFRWQQHGAPGGMARAVLQVEVASQLAAAS